ncbi:MAG: CHAT domain-containing protein [Deltaproteobacteria bacterium]|nr:CHAT domain-containing protein [Deltaproteobacteria bacterium]
MTKRRMVLMANIIITVSLFVTIAHGSVNEENILGDILTVYASGENAFRDYLITNKLNNRSIANLLMTKGNDYFWILHNENARKCYESSLLIYKDLHDSSGQAKAYKHLGDLFLRTGDYAKATEMYGRALPLFENTYNASGQAGIYLSRGEIHMRTGDNVGAFELYKQALTLYLKSGDATGQGNVYKGMADLYTRKRVFPKATELYEKARSLYGQTHNEAGQGRVYQSLVEIYRRTGNNVKALASAEKALALSLSAKDLLGEGDVFISIGDIHYFKSENAKALAIYHKALPIFLKADVPTGQAYIYWRLGLIALRMGDNVGALDMYNKALVLYQKVGEPIGMGRVYFDIGHLSYYKRDFVKALEFYEKALPYYLQADEPSGQGTVFRGMAYIYLMTGDYEKSLAMSDKALRQYEKADYPLGQANAFWNMGEANCYQGNDAKALEMYDKALLLFKQVGEPIGQGIIYLNMGGIYLKRGDYAKAIDINEKSLAIFLQAESPLDQVKAYKNLGDVYAKMQDNDKALKKYDLAFNLAQKIEDAEAEAYLLVKKAGVLGNQGRISEAVQLYEQGLSRFERVRGQAGFAEMKKSYMEKVYDHYQDATIFMLENKFSTKAFRYAESMKARVFLDQLAEGLVNLEEGIKPELKTKRDGIENSLARLQNKLQEEAAKSKPDKELIASLKEERSGAEAELETVKRKIRYENPRYASVQYPDPVTIEELQRRILNQDEVILEYFIAETGAYCFVVTTDTFEIVRLTEQGEAAAIAKAMSSGKKAPYLASTAASPTGPLKSTAATSPGAPTDSSGNLSTSASKTYLTRESLEADVNEWVEFLKTPQPLSAVKRTLAERLYAILMKPVAGYLQGKTIILVPDGILARLPFESLLVPSEEGMAFLVEKYRLKYVQSASILALLRTQYRQEGLSDRFIGFGDPVYDYENFKAGKEEEGSDMKGVTKSADLSRSGYLRSGGKLDRLVGSGKEVQEIVKLFGDKGRIGKPLLRIEATEAYAKDKGMEDYGYIHFSTHGILDDKFQAIALSQIPGDAEDGFLTLGEIMNSRYHARLVVLSACQTGLGKMERGEGVVGLTRAVMYAGTPATVVSLWSVSDEGTKELMVRFYENILKKGMTKDEALREAKRSMRASEDYRHPYYWSSFVMYGE